MLLWRPVGKTVVSGLLAKLWCLAYWQNCGGLLRKLWWPIGKTVVSRLIATPPPHHKLGFENTGRLYHHLHNYNSHHLNQRLFLKTINDDVHPHREHGRVQFLPGWLHELPSLQHQNKVLHRQVDDSG